MVSIKKLDDVPFKENAQRRNYFGSSIHMNKTKQNANLPHAQKPLVFHDKHLHNESLNNKQSIVANKTWFPTKIQK